MLAPFFFATSSRLRVSLQNLLDRGVTILTGSLCLYQTHAGRMS
jgi:hypothetical protein